MGFDSSEGTMYAPPIRVVSLLTSNAWADGAAAAMTAATAAPVITLLIDVMQNPLRPCRNGPLIPEGQDPFLTPIKNNISF